jgi:hypothetical protein
MKTVQDSRCPQANTPFCDANITTELDYLNEYAFVTGLENHCLNFVFAYREYYRNGIKTLGGVAHAAENLRNSGKLANNLYSQKSAVYKMKTFPLLHKRMLFFRQGNMWIL